MSPTTYLITGANRGLGLEYVRQIVAHEPDSRVIAAARNPDGAAELQKLIAAHPGKIEALQLDVSDQASIAAAAERAASLEFAKGGIDVLLNNAGVNVVGNANILEDNFFDGLEDNFKVNVFGVAHTSRAFLPLLRKGAQKKIWIVSSVSGSIGSQTSDTSAAYCTSKAAVNMLGVKLAKALEPEGFTVLLLHPGWVVTDMGGQKADIEVEESITGGLKTLHSKTKADTGTFWWYSGESMPW